MTTFNDLINNAENSTILVPKDGLLEVKIIYELPGSKRESVTTITYRCTTSANGEAGVDTESIYNRISPEDKSVTDIYIDAGFFGKQLRDKVVQYMQATQPETVTYRKINVQAFNGLAWENFKRESLPKQLPGNLFENQIVRVNSNLRESNIYKFKTESGITGKNVDSNFVQREALGFRCYVKGLESSGDKPSRFIVLGTVFKNSNQAYKSSAVKAIADHLKLGWTTQFGTRSYTFLPVFKVAGFLRPVAAVQIEGIKPLAGSKARSQAKQLDDISQTLNSAALNRTFTRQDQGTMPFSSGGTPQIINTQEFLYEQSSVGYGPNGPVRLSSEQNPPPPPPPPSPPGGGGAPAAPSPPGGAAG